MNTLWTKLLYLITILIDIVKFATAAQPPVLQKEVNFIFLNSSSSGDLDRVRRQRMSVNTYFEELEQDLSSDVVHGGNDGNHQSEPNPEFGFGDAQEVLLFRIEASIPGLEKSGEKLYPFIHVSYANGTSKNHFVHFHRTKTLTEADQLRWVEIITFEHYIRGGQQILQFEMRDHHGVGTWDHRIGWAWIDVDLCVLESRKKPTKLTVSDDKKYQNLISACSAPITDKNSRLTVILV